MAARSLQDALVAETQAPATAGLQDALEEFGGTRGLASWLVGLGMTKNVASGMRMVQRWRQGTRPKGASAALRRLGPTIRRRRTIELRRRLATTGGRIELIRGTVIVSDDERTRTIRNLQLSPLAWSDILRALSAGNRAETAEVFGQHVGLENFFGAPPIWTSVSGIQLA